MRRENERREEGRRKKEGRNEEAEIERSEINKEMYRVCVTYAYENNEFMYENMSEKWSNWWKVEKA